MTVLLVLIGLIVAAGALYLAAVGASMLWKTNLLMTHRGLVQEHRSLYAEGVTLTQQTRHYERLLKELEDPSYRTKLYQPGSETPPAL